MTGGAYHHDTPCPACGYNLRGLTGDPLRCPECGAETTRARLAELHGQMETRLRDLQFAIDLQTFAILVVILGLPTALFVFSPPVLLLALLANAALGMMLGAIGWRMAERLFLGPGGSRLLVRYQAWTTLVVITYPLSALVVGGVGYPAFRALGLPHEATLVFAILVAALVIGVLQVVLDPLGKIRGQQERAFRTLVDLMQEPDGGERHPAPSAPSLQPPNEADRVSPP